MCFQGRFPSFLVALGSTGGIIKLTCRCSLGIAVSSIFKIGVISGSMRVLLEGKLVILLQLGVLLEERLELLPQQGVHLGAELLLLMWREMHLQLDSLQEDHGSLKCAMQV